MNVSVVNCDLREINAQPPKVKTLYCELHCAKCDSSETPFVI